MLEVERDPVVVLGVAFATVVKFKRTLGMASAASTRMRLSPARDTE